MYNLQFTLVQVRVWTIVYYQTMGSGQSNDKNLLKFINFIKLKMYSLTIQRLRKHALWDFLTHPTHSLCTISKQKWPISEQNPPSPVIAEYMNGPFY